MIRLIGLENFFKHILGTLEKDFGRWHEFLLSPRHATHYPHGVIELMPCADQQFYDFKYVNGHPGNPLIGRLSVVAIGLLSDVVSGYSADDKWDDLIDSIQNSRNRCPVGKVPCPWVLKNIGHYRYGAQAEFQVLAFANIFPLKVIRFFDVDPKAMVKFSQKLIGQRFRPIPCGSIAEAVRDAGIVVTATAAKKRQSLLDIEDIAPGTFIPAMVGDCPGKTELSVEFLNYVKVVVEYQSQTLLEGEVQKCPANTIYAELWELVCKIKPGRQDDQENILFDSVSFALEDYSILRTVYELATAYQLGTELPLIPELDDPKNLFGLLDSSHPGSP